MPTMYSHVRDQKCKKVSVVGCKGVKDSAKPEIPKTDFSASSALAQPSDRCGGNSRTGLRCSLAAD